MLSMRRDQSNPAKTIELKEDFRGLQIVFT
jgi:hypothetical protein